MNRPPAAAERPAMKLKVTDLGRMGYAEGLAVQRDVNQRVIAGEAAPTLLLIEHDPVITISHRRGAGDHLLASPQQLSTLGIDVEETDRGGDITYHGPGQLVAYPILPLAPLSLNLARYVRLLEQIVIDTLAAFDVHGYREPGATGVWIRRAGGSPGVGTPGLGRDEEAHPAKICAMGVRIRKNVTMHGLALNVTTDLSHFQTIVPCGLPGRGVTSLERLLGERRPTMARVKAELIAQFQRAVVQRTSAAPSPRRPAKGES